MKLTVIRVTSHLEPFRQRVALVSQPLDVVPQLLRGGRGRQRRRQDVRLARYLRETAALLRKRAREPPQSLFLALDEGTLWKLWAHTHKTAS